MLHVPEPQTAAIQRFVASVHRRANRDFVAGKIRVTTLSAIIVSVVTDTAFVSQQMLQVWQDILVDVLQFAQELDESELRTMMQGLVARALQEDALSDISFSVNDNQAINGPPDNPYSINSKLGAKEPLDGSFSHTSTMSGNVKKHEMSTENKMGLEYDKENNNSYIQSIHALQVEKNIQHSNKAFGVEKHIQDSNQAFENPEFQDSNQALEIENPEFQDFLDGSFGDEPRDQDMNDFCDRSFGKQWNIKSIYENSPIAKKWDLNQNQISVNENLPVTKRFGFNQKIIANHSSIDKKFEFNQKSINEKSPIVKEFEFNQESSPIAKKWDFNRPSVRENSPLSNSSKNWDLNQESMPDHSPLGNSLKKWDFNQPSFLSEHPYPANSSMSEHSPLANSSNILQEDNNPFAPSESRIAFEDSPNTLCPHDLLDSSLDSAQTIDGYQKTPDKIIDIPRNAPMPKQSFVKSLRSSLGSSSVSSSGSNLGNALDLSLSADVPEFDESRFSQPWGHENPDQVLFIS